LLKSELKQRLQEEMRKYASLSFAEVSAISLPVKSSHGTPGSESFCQVDVRILQGQMSGQDRWVELIVSVDDGMPAPGILARAFSVVEPESGSVVIHEDGRVETFAKT
jgi:hypothetical protein